LGLFRALVIGLFILAIPVALIATNIRVAVSEQQVYDHAVRSYDAAETSRIPESELLRANNEIKRYLTSDDAGSLAIEVRNNQGRIEPLFTTRETAHMADVRELVRALFAAQVASVFTVLTLAVALTVWSPRILARAALRGALLTGGIIAGAGIVAASGFDSAWTQFHQVVFTNDFWELDPRTDHLIQMFPEAFWQEITTLIVMATLLEAFLVTVASVGYLLLTRPEEGELIASPASAVPDVTAEPRPTLATPKPRHLFR
jgi:integral membrane protein (TIGR01906 family)